VSFLGSFSAEDGDSEDELAGTHRKKRAPGGYGSDDDLWTDLAGHKDSGKASSSKSSRDRSNDPFIIRSMVRLDAALRLLFSATGVIATCFFVFLCVAWASSVRRCANVSTSPLSFMCVVPVSLPQQPAHRQSDASGDVDAIPIGHLPSSGVDTSIFGDFGMDGKKKHRKKKGGDSSGRHALALHAQGCCDLLTAVCLVCVHTAANALCFVWLFGFSHHTCVHLVTMPQSAHFLHRLVFFVC
jgi:hypothetical protein